MKKVAGGLIYDTSKEYAKEIVTVEYGFAMGDFYHSVETLYMTTHGRFFVHGKGGSMTIWCEVYGATTTAGEGIVPMSPQEALSWLEQKDVDIEKYPDVL